jgi:hypothetical protein
MFNKVNVVSIILTKLQNLNGDPPPSGKTLNSTTNRQLTSRRRPGPPGAITIFLHPVL